MRRLTSFIGIGLLMLLVNGWGVMLAAALCPHGGVHKRAATTEDHPGCHAQTNEPEPAHSHHQPSHGAKKVVVEPDQKDGTSLGQRAGSCAHCISQNNLPATMAKARESNVKKVDASIAQPVEQVFALSTKFAPAFVPTQHAPPIATTPRHLLLGVFLI